MFETTNQIKICINCIKNCIIRSHSKCHEMHRRCLPSFSKVSSLRLLRIDGHINLPIAKLFKDIHDAFLTLPKRNVAATRNMNSQDTSLEKKKCWRIPRMVAGENHMSIHVHSRFNRNQPHVPKNQLQTLQTKSLKPPQIPVLNLLLETSWDILGHRGTTKYHQHLSIVRAPPSFWVLWRLTRRQRSPLSSIRRAGNLRPWSWGKWKNTWEILTSASNTK